MVPAEPKITELELKSSSGLSKELLFLHLAMDQGYSPSPTVSQVESQDGLV